MVTCGNLWCVCCTFFPWLKWIEMRLDSIRRWCHIWNFFVPIVGSGFPKNNLQNFQNSMKLFVGFYYNIYTCQVYKNDLVLSVNYKAMLHSLIAKIAIFHDYLCYGYFSCVFSFLSPLLFIICFVSSSKWTEFRGKCAMITL